MARKAIPKRALNFSSKKAFKKYAAYGHMHGVFARSPGNTPIKIRGKAHKVSHKKP